MKNVILFVSLLVLSACNTTSTITKSNSVYNPATGKTETVSTSSQATQSTMKLMTRADLASQMCKIAGDGYKDYLVLSNTEVEFLPIVIQDGQYINLPETAKVKFKNVVNRPNAAAFDMGVCVEDVMKTGVERFFTSFYKDVFKFGRDIIPYGAGYAIADKLLNHFDENNKRLADSAGVKVNNVEAGATVAVGTDDAVVNVDNRQDEAGDNSTYNSCAGEIVDGKCVLPVQDAEVSDSEGSTCTSLGGVVVDDNGDGSPDRCSDGRGGTIPNVPLL